MFNLYSDYEDHHHTENVILNKLS